MNEVIEQLLAIIDDQQALIVKTTMIIAECQSVDEDIRQEISEESTRIRDTVRVLEG